MIIEIQIRGQLLRRIVRNRFLAQAICIADLPGPGQKVVDHLDFGQPTLGRQSADMAVRLGNGTLSSVAGHRVRLTQPVTVYVATHAQIVAGGAQGPQTFTQSLQIDLFFDLTGELEVDDNNQVTGASIVLNYAGNDLPSGGVPDELQDALNEVLEQVEQSTPLDLAPLAAALATTVAPGNVGVATDSAGTRVAIRLELAPVAANPSPAWAAFYSSVPDRLMGRDWSVFIDSSIITQTVSTQFASEMSGNGKFDLTSGPHVTWISWLPGVKTYFEGNLLNLCDFNTIGVEVTAYTTFSIEPGTPPQLKASTHLTWDLVDSDVLLCGLTKIAFLGFAGAVFGAPGGGIGAAIGAVVGIIVGIVGVAILADSADASDLPSLQQEGCEQTSPEDADYLDIVCRRNLNPVEVAFLGSLEPDQLAGTGSGLLLLGDAEVPQLEDQFFTIFKPFAWTQELNCNTKGVDIELEGLVKNSNAAGIGWKLCDVHVEKDVDHLGFFVPSYSSANEITILLEVSVWDAYFANPYPCQLYVRASCGTRWYDFGVLKQPPEPPPKEEIIDLWAHHCSPFYNDYWGGRNNPHWLIDPDPPWEHTLHRWDVVATGLLENHASVLADAEGRVIARAVAGASGHVVHSSVLTPAASQSGLQLGQKVGANQGVLRDEEGTPPADGRLLITQTLLGRQAAVALSGSLRAFALPGGEWANLFAAVTSTGLHVYALPAPDQRRARLTFQILDTGLRGVAALSGGMLLAGDDGVVFRRLQRDGRLGNPRTILGLPARGVTAFRGMGFALVEEGVQVIDAMLRPRMILPARSAQAVGTLAGKLAILHQGGRRLTLFELGRGSDPLPHAGETVDIPAEMRFRGDALVGSLDASETVELPGGNKIPVERDPWLAAAWRLPRQYVHVDQRRGRVTVLMALRRRHCWKLPYTPGPDRLLSCEPCGGPHR
jgi:hypothetical protein